MTHDEFEPQEGAARDLLQTFADLARTTRASPDFAARVMARAAQLPPPRPGWRARLMALWRRPSSARRRLAWAVLLVLALGGAVPQYTAWVKAYLLGVPVETLHEARLQAVLWEKNFTCAMQLDQHSSAYAAITDEYVNVVVWACPSGDVLVTLGAATDPTARRLVWVPVETLAPAPGQLSWLVRQAFAASERAEERERRSPTTRVLDQQWLPNKYIKRRVQLANNQCREEVINPHTGRVVESRPVPCN